MKNNAIDMLWRSYVEQVIPATAPDIQRIECRRAFYAGAAALLGSIMSALGPGEDVTETEVMHVDALHAELKQFAEDVKAGRA